MQRELSRNSKSSIQKSTMTERRVSEDTPSIHGIISAEIKNSGAYFVFPSETAAQAWARKICADTVRSVAANRFMAWDRFKEEIVRAGLKDKKPASAVLRRLFTRRLLRDNAASPFLQTIVPPGYADNGEAFTRFIASVLPQLAFWESKRSGGADGEDYDLAAIKIRYAAFLEKFGLFEPSWEKPPFRGEGKRCFIFYPETLEDFPEYRVLLDRPGVILVSPPPPQIPGLVFFTSAREELRNTVLEIRRLHSGGIPYADMALSVAALKDAEPYLTRELSLYDIPFILRAGKSLGDYGIGRLFSLAAECASSAFSFDPLKAFVLNTFIPWKNPGLNRDLVSFGINNHCVSPFSDRGRRTVDAWEEAFKNAGGVEIENHYALLKQKTGALAGAKTFREIREQYFVFRELLDMKRLGAESDAVLARCIEELSVLIEIEEELGGRALPFSPRGPVSDAFAFYTAHLKDKNYVPARESGGVNIYDYPVAAGAPFAYSFVLNASQSAAAVQYTPLGFLRQDKRRRLGLEDRDVSAAVFGLFLAGGPVRFSASAKSFSGWAIPHGFFAGREKTVEARTKTARTKTARTKTEQAADPWYAEKDWWASGTAFPEELFSIQKKGFAAWNEVLSLSRPGFCWNGPVPAGEIRTLIAGRIEARKKSPDGGFLVSATDMTEFFACPVSWLFRRVFDLEEYPVDAALLDDASLGNIYHKILQRLFERIRDDGGKFLPSKIGLYRAWAEELGISVIRSGREFRGLLAYPLLESLAAAAAKRICAMLKTEAKYFAGCEVDLLEKKLCVCLDEREGARLYLAGIIDRVSLSPGGAIIIDYKTGTSPGGRASVFDGTALKNFQMAAYTRLYEETAGRKVSGACFFSVRENDLKQVVGRLPRKRSGVPREEFQETLDALDSYADRFRRAVLALDFSGKIPYGECVSCSCKTICRSLYTLNPPARIDYAALSLALERQNGDGDVSLP